MEPATTSPRGRTPDQRKSAPNWKDIAAAKARVEARRRDTLAKQRKAADVELPELTADDMIAVSRMIPDYDPWECDARWEFVPELALDAVAWIHENCYHSESKWAGQRFILQPWQQAIVANIAGWVDRETGLRRFWYVLIYVARKNGKTPFAAMLIKLLLFHLRDPCAQIYGIASEFEQASHVWRHAQMSIAHNEELGELCKVNKGMSDRCITMLDDGSVYKVQTSKGESKHGQNPYAVVVDELHVIDNASLIEAVETSFASRPEHLAIYLTTSDFDRPSMCNQKYDYAKKVQTGSRGEVGDKAIRDDRFLPVIYELGREDDWADEANWIKANPNLGVSVNIEFMRAMCQRAKDDPAFENSFRRLHCNQRTEQEVRCIKMEEWDAGDVPKLSDDELKGVEVVGGLDAASKIDIAAFVLEFRFKDGRHYWLPTFWVPGENVKVRSKNDGVPYEVWVREGWLKASAGARIDHDMIRDDILELCARYGCKQIAYDNWNATQLGGQLEKAGIEVVDFPQRVKFYNEPTKDVRAMLGDGKLKHPKHPVFRWMASNLAITLDVNDNMMPNKQKSGEKIDGMSAGIMAHGLMLTHEPTPEVPVFCSVWGDE